MTVQYTSAWEGDHPPSSSSFSISLPLHFMKVFCVKEEEEEETHVLVVSAHCVGGEEVVVVVRMQLNLKKKGERSETVMHGGEKKKKKKSKTYASYKSDTVNTKAGKEEEKLVGRGG